MTVKVVVSSFNPGVNRSLRWSCCGKCSKRLELVDILVIHSFYLGSSSEIESFDIGNEEVIACRIRTHSFGSDDQQHSTACMIYIHREHSSARVGILAKGLSLREWDFCLYHQTIFAVFGIRLRDVVNG